MKVFVNEITLFEGFCLFVSVCFLHWCENGMKYMAEGNS